jgi:hypothetical protein
MSDTFEDVQLDPAICSLVRQAIVLAQNYKEMLLQGDEVDLRIRLWRDALEICNVHCKGLSCIYTQRTSTLNHAYYS